MLSSRALASTLFKGSLGFLETRKRVAFVSSLSFSQTRQRLAFSLGERLCLAAKLALSQLVEVPYSMCHRHRPQELLGSPFEGIDPAFKVRVHDSDDRVERCTPEQCNVSTR